MSDPIHQRLIDALLDREAGGPKPIFWSPVGLAIAAGGLVVFVQHLGGRAYGSDVSQGVGTFFGLFMATSGIVTFWRGITLTFPTVAERWWVRWSARVVLVPLVLATVAVAGLLVVDCVLR